MKNIQGTIDNPLNKLKILHGYYYTENEEARKLGYSNDERQVGVSAQEVFSVLPEAVAPAPINENFNPKLDYKTVRYERIVALLIEAVKELEDRVKELEEKK